MALDLETVMGHKINSLLIMSPKDLNKSNEVKRRKALPSIRDLTQEALVYLLNHFDQLFDDVQQALLARVHVIDGPTLTTLLKQIDKNSDNNLLNSVIAGLKGKYDPFVLDIITMVSTHSGLILKNSSNTDIVASIHITMNNRDMASPSYISTESFSVSMLSYQVAEFETQLKLFQQEQQNCKDRLAAGTPLANEEELLAEFVLEERKTQEAMTVSLFPLHFPHSNITTSC